MQAAKSESLDRIIKLTNELRIYHNDILKKIDQKEAELKQLLCELAKPRTGWDRSLNRALGNETARILHAIPLPIHRASSSSSEEDEDELGKPKEGKCDYGDHLRNEETVKESAFTRGAGDSVLRSLTVEQRRFLVVRRPNAREFPPSCEAGVDSLDLSPIARLPFDQDRSFDERDEEEKEEEEGGGIASQGPPAAAKRVRFTSQSPLVSIFPVEETPKEEEMDDQKIFNRMRECEASTPTPPLSNSASSSPAMSGEAEAARDSSEGRPGRRSSPIYLARSRRERTRKGGRSLAELETTPSALETTFNALETTPLPPRPLPRPARVAAFRRIATPPHRPSKPVMLAGGPTLYFS
ncbi:unnamed protein product [Phytomonas sp. EM1]|nr:unnamed protein product [Phytomonas sp. EM1]|eukprot:CCW62780.1 unnamed protein product [Phytomonas sp. isolate EM1]